MDWHVTACCPPMFGKGAFHLAHLGHQIGLWSTRMLYIHMYNYNTYIYCKYIYMCVYIYIYMCVCVYVFGWVKQPEGRNLLVPHMIIQVWAEGLRIGRLAFFGARNEVYTWKLFHFFQESLQKTLLGLIQPAWSKLWPWILGWKEGAPGFIHRHSDRLMDEQVRVRLFLDLMWIWLRLD